MKAISLIPLHHFQPLHRHVGISRAITSESLPLHIATTSLKQELSSEIVSFGPI